MKELKQFGPWWLWLPVIGIILAGIKYFRVWAMHGKACRDYHTGRGSTSRTWECYDMTWVWFGNVTKAFMSTVAFLVLLRFLVS